MNNEDKIEKLYKISRIIMTLIAFILFNIWFIYENDQNWILSSLFTIIVFAVSYSSTKISKKIINFADKLESKLKKILYYAIALPIVLVLFSVVLVGITLFINEILISNLGTALLFMFLSIVEIICVMVPYFQVLIVLLLKHFIK